MKLPPALLIVGMFAVSGWAEDAKPEPYSAELVQKAEAGDAEAQYNLGVSYYGGKGVAKDYKEAVKWYTKSANQDNPRGQMRLGDSYYYGQGVSQDYKEAVKWYRKAGTSSTEYKLGLCYENGNGVTKDEKEAVKWYTKAAEQNYEDAKKALERMKSK